MVNKLDIIRNNMLFKVRDIVKNLYSSMFNCIDNIFQTVKTLLKDDREFDVNCKFISNYTTRLMKIKKKSIIFVVNYNSRNNCNPFN